MTEATSAMSVPSIERALAVALAVYPERFKDTADIVAAADFEDRSARSVFEALETVEALRTPPGDLPSLVAWLDVERRAYCTCPNGWLEWINEESLKVTTAAKAPHWASTIARAALARKLDSLLSSLRCDVQTASPVDHEAHEQLLEQALRQIAELVEASRKREATHAMSAGTQAVVDAPKTAPWIPMGLTDLDNVTHGFHRDDVVVIAARTSQGKSTLALQVAMNAAHAGAKTLVCSLEMSSEQLSRRVLSNLSGLPLFNLSRELTPDERQGLAIAQVQVAGWPMSIMATKGTETPAKIRATARSVSKTTGLDLLVVDYIQLLSEVSVAKQGRAAEVSAISHAFKALASELHCTVVMVAQLNRGADHDDRPKLHHLRESGAIEHDADVVLLLSTRDEEPGVMHCDVAKNRHGECRSVRLQWMRPLYSVRNLALRSESIYS